MLERKVLLALLADSAATIASSAASRSRFNSWLFFCSIFTIWLLRWTLMKLMTANTIKAAMTDITVIAILIVEFIICVVLVATYSAGINSIRVMSYAVSVVRQ